MVTAAVRACASLTDARIYGPLLKELSNVRNWNFPDDFTGGREKTSRFGYMQEEKKSVVVFFFFFLMVKCRRGRRKVCARVGFLIALFPFSISF